MGFWGWPAAAPGRRLWPRPGAPFAPPVAASRRKPGFGSRVRPLRWPGRGPRPAHPGRLLCVFPVSGRRPRVAPLRFRVLCLRSRGTRLTGGGPPVWPLRRPDPRSAVFRSGRGRPLCSKPFSPMFHSRRPQGPRLNAAPASNGAYLRVPTGVILLTQLLTLVVPCARRGSRAARSRCAQERRRGNSTLVSAGPPGGDGIGRATLALGALTRYFRSRPGGPSRARPARKSLLQALSFVRPPFRRRRPGVCSLKGLGHGTGVHARGNSL